MPERTEPAYARYSARSRIDDVRSQICAFVTLLELVDDAAKADLFGGALNRLAAARRVWREIALELDHAQANLTRAAELVGGADVSAVRMGGRSSGGWGRR